ncbi:hypothetical protein RRG08_067249 [Elysia crispata]|uniref:Uncharacterized protein n=1 Tax=Elysia crispata TaxID=231223 RepID=A0AAE1E6K6_9GAST|nr:hypothetical protein RRG08_067249 [Elysia crispata]
MIRTLITITQILVTAESRSRHYRSAGRITFEAGQIPYTRVKIANIRDWRLDQVSEEISITYHNDIGLARFEVYVLSISQIMADLITHQACDGFYLLRRVFALVASLDLFKILQMKKKIKYRCCEIFPK